MYNIYHNGIKWWQALSQTGRWCWIFVLHISERLCECHHSCIEFSLRQPIPAIFPHSGASWRWPVLNTWRTFCRMRLDGDDLQEHFKCWIYTMAHRNPAVSRVCWHLDFSTSRLPDGKALSVVNNKGKRFQLSLKETEFSAVLLSLSLYLCKLGIYFLMGRDDM